MEEIYVFKGIAITVRAIKKQIDQEPWEPVITIAGNRHLLNAFDQYPPRLFADAESAIAYGKEAAEFVVDHRTRTKKPIS